MLSDDKLQWLKEIGAKTFETPMDVYTPDGTLYSLQYLRETPLEVLKRNDKGGFVSMGLLPVELLRNVKAILKFEGSRDGLNTYRDLIDEIEEVLKHDC